MTRVQVYYNLHQHCLSVKDKATGRVILHTPDIHLGNCKFVVRPAGREKVRREGRKNVHAFVEGDLLSWTSGTVLEASALCNWDIEEFCERRCLPILLPDRAYYDPYQVDQFHRLAGRDKGKLGPPLDEVARCHIIGKKIHIPREKKESIACLG